MDYYNYKKSLSILSISKFITKMKRESSDWQWEGTISWKLIIKHFLNDILFYIWWSTLIQKKRKGEYLFPTSEITTIKKINSVSRISEGTIEWGDLSVPVPTPINTKTILPPTSSLSLRTLPTKQILIRLLQLSLPVGSKKQVGWVLGKKVLGYQQNSIKSNHR